MRRRILAATALLLIASPARAVVAPAAYAERLHVVQAGQVDGAPVEVNLFAGTGEILLDSSGQGEPVETGGCVDLFRPRGNDFIVESACGSFGVHPEPLLASTHLGGALEGEAFLYRNDPENGPTYEFLGPTTITLDLTFTGTGDHRLEHSERTGVGVCGLPPDTRGAYLLLEAPIGRTATVSGTLSSSVGGSVDPSTLNATMLESSRAETGACVDV